MGDLMVDVVAKLSGPLAPGSDRPAEIELRGGGSAANTACWLAALGADVRLVARVGPVDDPWATAATHGMPDNLSAGLTRDGRPTGRCIVRVAPDGERTMVPDTGANVGLSGADLDPRRLGLRGHLHLSGYVLLGAGRRAGVDMLAAARQAQATISVDAASAGPLAALGTDAFRRLIGRDVLLFANRAEASVLTGHRDPEVAAATLAAWVGGAVVKCGRDGAVWSDGRRTVSRPAQARTVVDSTGAGDAFAAGFLRAWTAGERPVDALDAGHRTAARACALIGGRPPV